MTMAEIGAEWDRPSTDLPVRSTMMRELPEMWDDYENINTCLSNEEIDAEVFGADWAHVADTVFDVKPYFERYCKK